MEAFRTHQAVNILEPPRETLLILWQKWRNIFSPPTQLWHIPKKELSMPQSIGLRMRVVPLVLCCHIWTALENKEHTPNCSHVIGHIYLEINWNEHPYTYKLLHNQKLAVSHRNSVNRIKINSKELKDCFYVRSCLY